MFLPLQLLDIFADVARFFFRIPDASDLRFGAELAICEQRLAEPPLVSRDQMRGGSKDMPGRTIIALKAYDLGARKILLEAQDVVDVGATPAIDRLIVVPNAAHVAASL